MEDPIVSIIIPVFNAEEYLPTCIESVIRQTFISFELILINDGSTDSSGRVCDNFASKDLRIKVLHTSNNGVSAARNLGIINAKGRFIIFIDSDDYINDEFIHNLLDFSSYDLVVSGYNSIFNLSVSANKYPILRAFNQEKIIDAAIIGFDYGLINSPWAKLFRKDIIFKYNLSFKENMSYGEDHIFVLEYLQNASSVLFFNKCDYFYRQNNNNSLTRKVVVPDKIIYYINKATMLTMLLDVNSNFQYKILTQKCKFYIMALINSIKLKDYNMSLFILDKIKSSRIVIHDSFKYCICSYLLLALPKFLCLIFLKCFLKVKFKLN